MNTRTIPRPRGDVEPAERYPQPPAEVELAWAEYCTARRRAELSGAIADAIAAGKAWRAWLEIFEE